MTKHDLTVRSEFARAKTEERLAALRETKRRTINAAEAAEAAIARSGAILAATSEREDDA